MATVTSARFLRDVTRDGVKEQRIEAFWDDGDTIQTGFPPRANIPPPPEPTENDPAPFDTWKEIREIQVWVDGGGVPTAYDPDYGLTPEQITDRDERVAIKAEFTDMVGSMEPINRALLKLAFANHNKIRALEGNPAHTKAEFAQWLEANT